MYRFQVRLKFGRHEQTSGCTLVWPICFISHFIHFNGSVFAGYLHKICEVICAIVVRYVRIL